MMELLTSILWIIVFISIAMQLALACAFLSMISAVKRHNTDLIKHLEAISNKLSSENIDLDVQKTVASLRMSVADFTESMYGEKNAMMSQLSSARAEIERLSELSRDVVNKVQGSSVIESEEDKLANERSLLATIDALDPVVPVEFEYIDFEDDLSKGDLDEKDVTDKADIVDKEEDISISES